MKIRLIVPHCVQPNGDRTNPVTVYGKAIADIAGGFTASQATGGWIDGDGELIVEPVTVFDIVVAQEYISTNATSGQSSVGPAMRFHDLAKRIARELHQDCVYLEIDGHVELVRQ